MKQLNKVIFWAIVLFLQQHLLVQIFAAEPERITLPELKRLLDAKENVILIDVRNQIDYSLGHIPGAISMSFPEGIESKHQILPPDGLIVLY